MLGVEECGGGIRKARDSRRVICSAGTVHGAKDTTTAFGRAVDDGGVRPSPKPAGVAGPTRLPFLVSRD